VKVLFVLGELSQRLKVLENLRTLLVPVTAFLSLNHLAVHPACADSEFYSVSPGTYLEVLKSKGAPLLDGIRLMLKPDPSYFPWLSSAAGENKGVNFAIAGAPIADIKECSDSAGYLDHFSGIASPRLYASGDTSAVRKFAFAMAHRSWSFQADEERVARLLTEGSNYFEAFNKIGVLESLEVGKDDGAEIKFYRSLSSATVIGLCIKDPNAKGGERCIGLANTNIAGYEIDLDPQVYERGTRVECVLKALSTMEKATEMHELPAD